MSTVTVGLDDCTYDIHIKPRLLSQCGLRLREVLSTRWSALRCIALHRATVWVILVLACRNHDAVVRSR